MAADDIAQLKQQVRNLSRQFAEFQTTFVRTRNQQRQKRTELEERLEQLEAALQKRKVVKGAE